MEPLRLLLQDLTRRRISFTRDLTTAELECHPYWEKWKDESGDTAMYARLLIGTEVALAKERLKNS